MQHLVVGVLVLLVASTPAPAAAKPPPSAPGPGDGPGVSPWAAYAGKKGPVQDRSLLGLEGATSSEDTSGSLGSSGIGSPFGGPMSPFLKLKPFLPAKPAFAPPVVDPSKFIDMKADFLSSLFPGGVPMAAAPGVVAGAAPAGYLSSRALFSPFDTPAAPVVTKAPPPAFLADLFKALSINKTVANASDTPVFPGPTPLIDPTVFISKKAKFLSDLFASLPTTPAPAPTPDPAALNVELAASFQRVLDALAATERPPLQDAPEDEVEQALTAKEKRSMDSSAAVLGLTDAKDKVVDTIISELAELKDSMVGAVADLANAQKAADAAAAATAPKKPLSPYAAMWAKPTAAKASLPTAVPLEPVRQKVVLLGHVFDILTDMEKDIASSMAISLNTIQNVTETPTPSPDVFDVLKARISQIVEQQNSTSASPATANQTTPLTSSKTLRLAGEAVQAPTPVLIDPSFWIPDSTASAPDTYLAKSKAFIATIMAAKSTPSPIMRRSYKPSYPLQGEGQESQTSLYPNPAEQQHKSGQNSPGIVYVPQQQQHHHHNHQPYWWK